MIRERLGRNMGRLPQSIGWSQEEIAHHAGLHRTYVSDLECGARNPTITMVDKLPVALGVPVGDLLDEQCSEAS